MKLIIDISNEEYSALQSASYCNFDKYTAYLAMKNGTPLPKHHGRLIDADELKQELINKEWITDYDGDGLENIVDEAPTIIEGSDPE